MMPDKNFKMISSLILDIKDPDINEKYSSTAKPPIS
jgi:hypothetical protein